VYLCAETHDFLGRRKRARRQEGTLAQKWSLFFFYREMFSFILSFLFLVEITVGALKFSSPTFRNFFFGQDHGVQPEIGKLCLKQRLFLKEVPYNRKLKEE
jgi:hypothetical protein